MIPGNHEIANHFGRQDKSLYKMLFGPLYYWFFLRRCDVYRFGFFGREI